MNNIQILGLVLVSISVILLFISIVSILIYMLCTSIVEWTKETRRLYQLDKTEFWFRLILIIMPICGIWIYLLGLAIKHLL